MNKSRQQRILIVEAEGANCQTITSSAARELMPQSRLCAVTCPRSP